MPDSGNNVRDHFIKQRRNLVICSLVLIFYHSGGFTFNELNIFGNKTTIGNPEIVSVALFIFFFYFLWRYFTAFNEVLGMGRVKVAAFKRVDTYILACISKRVLKAIGLKHNQFYMDKINRYNSSNAVIREYRYKLATTLPSITSEQRAFLLSAEPQEVKGLELTRIEFKAFIVSAFKDSDFGEYIVPFILAVLALCEMLGFGVVGLFLKLFN